MGFLEPFPLLSPTECTAVVAAGRAAGPEASWLKGLHEFDTACTRAALVPELVTLVSELLGDDVILWSMQLIDQNHGVRHRWHSDAEAMTWPTVDVWVGLCNVGTNSFLSVLERSHLWGLAPQEFTPTLDLLDDDAVRRAALELDPGSSRRDFPMGVGEALVFDGRLWHASQTPGLDRRTALLLQYSPASAVPRVLKHAVSPPVWEQHRPGCVLVSGDGSTLDPSNRLIRPRRLRRHHPWRDSLRLARRIASGLYRSAFQPGWRNR